MTPLAATAVEPFEFVDEVRGGRIPREYVPAVKQGFMEELKKGPLGEFEVVGIKIVLSDGDYHEQDSSDLSFRLCAGETMRDVILPQAEMVLLEPVMTVEVETPEQFQGSVTGHLLRKRGLVTSSETREGTCVSVAEVPLAEMFDYANEIRSMTQGQGNFTMEFSRYSRTPRDVQKSVLAKHRQKS